MSIIPAALLGAASWSATEYGLHRFAMHELKGKGLASKEHLQHHADVTYFTPTSKKLLSATATSTVAFPVAWAIAGRRNAVAYTTGMIAAYFGYEVVHRRIHVSPPRNAYGRWLRRSHLHHHFGKPRRNFGVTTPVWDRVFGTYDDPGVVTMPRRMAPVWMLDDDGEVHPAYAADYRVKGRREATDERTRQDHDDAFANRPPVIDEATAEGAGQPTAAA